MVRGGVVLVALIAVVSAARADDIEPGDDGVDIDFWYEDAAFDTVDVDTGWVPSGSDVQVRFGIKILGLTQVGLGGSVYSTWPESITTDIPGRTETGWLSIGYGIELLAKIRIDTEVLGIPYYWEGDLPLGDIPTDLLMAADLVFDPWVLPGDDPRPVTVLDTTDRIPVYTYDITGGLIDIPGVSGKLTVDLQGQLEAEYRTHRIELTVADPIAQSGATTLIEAADETGYGRALDYQVFPVGELDYTGTINLYPHIKVEILGIDIIDADLFVLPLELVQLDEEIVFDPDDVHVPLPDVTVTPDQVTVTTAGTAIRVGNEGEKILGVQITEFPEELSPLAPFFTLDPGQSVDVPLLLLDSAVPFERDAIVTLSTTDPDTPTVTISITLQHPGDPDADPNPDPDPDPDPDGSGDPDSGCGCVVGGRRTRYGGQYGAVPLLVLLGIALVARRRRATR